MATLQELTKQWLEAKADERLANSRRLAIESEMLNKLELREEGSVTTDIGEGMKITTTGKLSYKVDVQMLDQLTMDWTPDMKPLKVKVEADDTKLKRIRHDNPALWKQIAKAVEVKPQKTAITVSIEE